MQIEVTEQTSNELQRRAGAAGLEVSAYLEMLVLATTAPAEASRSSQPLSVEQWQEMLDRSGATSLRNGRSWREFAHEGHKY